MVSIGEHSLFLVAAGCERGLTRNDRAQPAVIIEAGLGSSHNEWAAVIRILAKRARVYAYDRAGYGLSQPSATQEYSAEARVNDLSKLLEVTEIQPPYVFVGHSYGGILAKEFLRRFRHEKDIVGLVMVDCPWARNPLPHDWATLLGESTYNSIVGLDANHAVSVDEYEAIKKDEKLNAPTALIEEQYVEQCSEDVNNALPKDHSVLGDSPLSVIFAGESTDFAKVYNRGVKHGYGTDKAKQHLAAWLRNMEQTEESDQRVNLLLSGNSRFVYAEGKAKTHNLQYVAPELISREVFWVLGLTQ